MTSLNMASPQVTLSSSFSSAAAMAAAETPAAASDSAAPPALLGDDAKMTEEEADDILRGCPVVMLDERSAMATHKGKSDTIKQVKNKPGCSQGTQTVAVCSAYPGKKRLYAYQHRHSKFPRLATTGGQSETIYMARLLRHIETEI